MDCGRPSWFCASMASLSLVPSSAHRSCCWTCLLLWLVYLVLTSCCWVELDLELEVWQHHFWYCVWDELALQMQRLQQELLALLLAAALVASSCDDGSRLEDPCFEYVVCVLQAEQPFHC